MSRHSWVCWPPKLKWRKKVKWAVQQGDVLLRSGGFARRPGEYTEGQIWEITKVRWVLGSGSLKMHWKESLASISDYSRALYEQHEDIICVERKEDSPWYGPYGWKPVKEEIKLSSGAFISVSSFLGKYESLRCSSCQCDGKGHWLGRLGIGPRTYRAQFWTNLAQHFARNGRRKIKKRTCSEEYKKEKCTKKDYITSYIDEEVLGPYYSVPA